MDPSPNRLICAPHGTPPGPPTPRMSDTMQTLRAVVVPSPTSSFTGSPSVAGIPQDRGHGVKRKHEPENPQPSWKKSRDSFTHAAVTPSSRPVVGTEPPVKYGSLLASLADQYIAEARGVESYVATEGQHLRVQQSEKYCKLVATGLACLEVLLKEKSAWRPDPRQEATVMLKYCNLLFEETDNDAHAETILTKGIALCDRHRLFDLKYSMQYLSAKYMFKSTTPKAMETYLETVINDAETYQHTIWVYAFLFLRISLLFSNRSNTKNILRDLAKASAMAKRLRDPSIGALASVLEALLHLQNRTTNWLDDAQHAIAAARSQQLSASKLGLTQLETMIYILDISCSLNPYDYKQAKQKIQAMHDYFKSTPQIKQNHNILSVPVSGKDEQLTLESAGVFARSESGQTCLSLAWISPSELYVLGSLVSGLALWCRNPSERKAEMFFRDCLQHLESKERSPKAFDGLNQHSACAATLRRRVLYSYALLYQTLAQADRESWPAAKESLSTFNTSVKSYEDALEPPVRKIFASLSIYLTAIIAQGTGDFNLALSYYTTAPLALGPYSSHETATPQHTMCILSAFNALLITHSPKHPPNSLTTTLTDRLKPYFAPGTPYATNPHLVATHTFLQSVMLSSTPNPLAQTPTTPAHPQVQILPTKQLLQRSLNASKTAANTQLLTLTLTVVHHAFFSGQVGVQALSAAKAARSTAKDGARGLWVAVCDGVVGGVMERMGMREDAEKVVGEGLGIVIPEALR